MIYNSDSQLCGNMRLEHDAIINYFVIEAAHNQLIAHRKNCMIITFTYMYYKT